MDSQGFQYGFQHVSSYFAWCCYYSRRRDTQRFPQVSVQSVSRFSDQPPHDLHSKLQSNTMKIEDIDREPSSARKMLEPILKFVFHGRGILMHIGHMTPHALSCFENLLTKFTLQARMCDVESFNVPRHITLELELLATVEATPHRPPYGIHYSCHVRSDQGIKIVEPCKQMSRQKTKPQSSRQQDMVMDTNITS